MWTQFSMFPLWRTVPTFLKLYAGQSVSQAQHSIDQQMGIVQQIDRSEDGVCHQEKETEHSVWINRMK